MPIKKFKIEITALIEEDEEAAKQSIVDQVKEMGVIAGRYQIEVRNAKVVKE